MAVMGWPIVKTFHQKKTELIAEVGTCTPWKFNRTINTRAAI